MADTAKSVEHAPRELAIGVDLGGTHVLAALIDPSGRVHSRNQIKLAASSRSSQDSIGSAVSACVLDAWRHAHAHFPECLPLRGIGIAVPGNVDPHRNMVRYLPNFGWLDPVDLAALVLDRPAVGVEGETTTVRELLGVDRLHMRNDGRCAALAERHFGIGASGEHSVMAMLMLGTGIGGALIHSPALANQGALFEGSTFDAGDFGHHVMRSGPDAFQCVCGKRGCFECHASAAGLVRHWRAAGGDEGACSLDDARSVVQRMRDGDPVAMAAFSSYRSDLATGLANLITFYNPSLIVLGGGLSATAELYDGLAQAVDRSTLPATRGLCSIAQSALGADCAAMGAAWLAFAHRAEALAGHSHSMPGPLAAPPAVLSTAKKGSIVCLGIVCMDIIMRVSAHPTPDTKSVASQSYTCGGGNAANSAVAASRLRAVGDPLIRLISKVGSDSHGEALLLELARDQVDTRWVVRAPPGHKTPSSVILVCGPSRTIVNDPGLLQSAPLLPDEFESVMDPVAVGEEFSERSKENARSTRPATSSLRAAWLEDAALLHLDGRHPIAAVHAARCARSAGVPILLDVERPRPGLRDLMPLADYVVSSSDFACKLAIELSKERSTDGATPSAPELDASNPVTLVAFVLGHCPNARWVCVTLGPDGAIALERGGSASIQVPAWPLPTADPDAVRDTTGAGDAFIGATAAALRRGLPLADVLRIAACVAAANCGADGARGGMPLLSGLPPELRALLSTSGG